MKRKTVWTFAVLAICAILTLGGAPAPDLGSATSGPGPLGDVPSTHLNMDGTPALETVRYVTDETADPLVLANVPAGGTEFITGGSASGNVTAGRPDTRIDFVASTPRSNVYISADLASQDLVLFVYAPDGRWYANDNRVGLNPGVIIPVCPSGVIDIWIGTKTEAPGLLANLTLTLLAPAWAQ